MAFQRFRGLWQPEVGGEGRISSTERGYVLVPSLGCGSGELSTGVLQPLAPLQLPLTSVPVSSLAALGAACGEGCGGAGRGSCAGLPEGADWGGPGGGGMLGWALLLPAEA